MDITVRKAQLQDIPAILEMNAELNGPGVNATHESMADSLENNKNEIVFVALHDGKAVGFACGLMYLSICYSNGMQGELTELYVSSEYRRNGVATKLVEHMERVFAKNNVHEITLKTGIKNEQAHRFYESCGYKLRRYVYIKDMLNGNGEKI